MKQYDDNKPNYILCISYKYDIIFYIKMLIFPYYILEV